MYEAFYGFKEKPFSMLPDPSFLYLSKKHQAALTLLEYGLLNHVGFCIISGEPGAGKTTILRALLERIEDDVTVGLISNTHQSFGGLLDWVLSVFDLHRPNLTHVEMHQIFMEYLIEEYANGRTVLLIVDEAQNMQPDTLEELRMLSNVNTEKDQLMQVVLAGQPALRDTLRLPDLMQFAQRIAVDYHLGPLGLEETCGYIQHRLITAGAQKDIFTPAACERIHNYSGGIPRLINLLCETVLVYGFADQLDMIDVDLVDEMVLERMKDSVVPIVNRDIARQDNTQASKELEKDFPWIQPKDGTEGLKLREEKSQFVEQAEKPVIADVAEKTAAAVDDQKEDKTPGNEEGIIAKAPSTQAGQPASADVKSDAGSVIVSRIEETEKKNFVKGEDGTRKQLIQYSAIAAALAVALIIFALLLSGEEGPAIKQVATDKPVKEDLLQKREQEEKERLLRQLQIEAETLKKERDAAIAKAEEERRINLEAEKQSAAKAALAAEEAAEKRRLEEKKRIDAAKKRERKAKQAEVKAREEVKRAKRESAKLAEQRRVMQLRLDEERRLRKLEEAHRLELERQQLQAAEASAAEKVATEKAAAEKVAEAAEKAKAKSTECSGPAARFKANCR